MATCSGAVILHDDGTVAGCVEDDEPDGCRGRELRHEGSPMSCIFWTLDGVGAGNASLLVTALSLSVSRGREPRGFGRVSSFVSPRSADHRLAGTVALDANGTRRRLPVRLVVCANRTRRPITGRTNNHPMSRGRSEGTAPTQCNSAASAHSFEYRNVAFDCGFTRRAVPPGMEASHYLRDRKPGATHVAKVSHCDR
jgi:hypothetical protein